MKDILIDFAQIMLGREGPASAALVWVTFVLMLALIGVVIADMTGVLS